MLTTWTNGNGTIAIVGTPRGGTTIVAKCINSIGGVFIVSEPYQAALKPRPEHMEFWPMIIETKYGNFGIVPGQNAFDQVKNFANAMEPGLSVIGFKECETNTIPASTLTASLCASGEVDRAIVVLRHPRMVYESMNWNTPEGHRPISADELVQMYRNLEFFALNHAEKVRVMFLDWFRMNPVKEIQRATGWSISGRTFDTLSPLPGGGDPRAHGSKTVELVDSRRMSTSSYLKEAVSIYESLWIPQALQRIDRNERVMV